jgi:uncharacterized protein (DUF433 family)
MINVNKHIVTDSKTKELIIKGTKITVDLILNKMLEGWGTKEIRDKYKLSQEQIEAVLKHMIVQSPEAVYVYS